MNLMPVTSIYRWQGRLEHDSEVKLVIKTHRAQVEELIARVTALHSYDVCEVTVLPIVAGNPAYLDWIDENTGS